MIEHSLQIGPSLAVDSNLLRPLWAQVSLSLARPAWLIILALVPLFLLALPYSLRRRRRALAAFADPAAVPPLIIGNIRSRRWGRLCLLVAIVLLAIALAGPRWGKGDTSISVGRDLVIVLDFSKSMLSADMAAIDHRQRWEAACEGIRELVDSVRQRGGHRLGLVVFAAKAWTVCPLTADYDHFLMRLSEFSPLAPPIQMKVEPEEGILSGTRIGTGIIEGLNAHDPRFPGYQDVLLISDGDDPAPAADRDDEIAAGIRLAQEKNIPVHVVGVGDTDNALPVVIVRSNGQEDLLGTSQLIEGPLAKIAQQTRGIYRTWGRQTPELATFFEEQIANQPSRELSEDALPQPREQYVWFLTPALVFLLAGWWLER